MNEYERQRRIAESTKKLYPPGTRIELISMKDPYAPVPAGTRGTVKFVDSSGTIFPEWDNGRSLGVVPGEDSFRKLTQEEIKAENQSMSEVEDYPACFYCDPPYYSSEYVYQCGFTWDDHLRLKNTLANSKGKWFVSYNDCEEICNLYDGYSFFDFTRLHNMKQRINAGEQFPELLISNYDMYERQRNKPLQLSLLDLTTEQQIDLEQILKECILRKHTA